MHRVFMIYVDVCWCFNLVYVWLIWICVYCLMLNVYGVLRFKVYNYCGLCLWFRWWSFMMYCDLCLWLCCLAICLWICVIYVYDLLSIVYDLFWIVLWFNVDYVLFNVICVCYLLLIVYDYLWRFVYWLIWFAYNILWIVFIVYSELWLSCKLNLFMMSCDLCLWIKVDD